MAKSDNYKVTIYGIYHTEKDPDTEKYQEMSQVYDKNTKTKEAAAEERYQRALKTAGKRIYTGYDIISDDPQFENNNGKPVNDEIKEKGAETTEDIQKNQDKKVDTSTGNKGSNSTSDESINEKTTEVEQAVMYHAAWDPRLLRLDEFFMIPDKEDDTRVALRVPFGSQTAVTAFADQTNTMPIGLVAAMIKGKKIKSDSYIAKQFSIIKKSYGVEDEGSSTSEKGKKANDQTYKAATTYTITHDTKELENDSNNFGVQSIMNPYSVTKLMGGLDITGKSINNYMYDIRDQRRFYDVNMNGKGSDFITVSNPTISYLIQWANADKWGRTPYSFQDFVYCKYFGLIPNNRLITFRRYEAPTYDNLQFPNMFGNTEQTTKGNNGQSQTEQTNANAPENITHKVFSPHAYVVTWFGGETGNSLSNLMSFSTGINWKDIKADVWDVTGEEGESKQEVIDTLLGDGGEHTGLFHSAELTKLNSAFQSASTITAKLASFGKFTLGFKKNIGMSKDAYENLWGANVDPYESTYRNKIKGPINRIDTVKARDAGIKFSQTLNIKCAYKAKAIGGINPKAALLDILGNCLEMVSPHAVFWGGGHRFMIKPRIYPFRDGEWRDNFMDRIYKGEFLGKNGAIATVLSGFTKVGTPEGGGGFNFDTAKSALGSMLKDGLGILGGAISSLSNVFGNVDFLNSAADMFYNAAGDGTAEGKAKAEAKGKGMAKKFFNNLQTMWHSRMLASTSLPKINAQGNILVGEPTGEWHLTIGNPLNPIMVIGNLICSDMKVTWDDELGPDDFPTGFTVDYTIEHAMPRDSDAIQSMFNRGMGKFYTLPDYMATSSDRTTYVDKFTKNAGSGETGNIPYQTTSYVMSQYGHGYQTYKIEPGSPAPNAGSYNTTLITKFNPLNSEAQRKIHNRRNSDVGTISRIKSLAATRKLTNV